MKRDVVRFHPPGPLVALVGNPNCGKTALFNRLTGSRQKVANYAGVTVERKEGRLITPAGTAVRMLDLPGVYSLSARSPDEQVTVQVLQGRLAGERRPTLVVCVVDATNLRRSLRLVLAVRRLGIPCVVALNMTDAAERRGIPIDPAALSAALGIPVAPTVAIQPRGADALLALLDDPDAWPNAAPCGTHDPVQDSPAGDHEAVQAILARLGLDHVVPHTTTDRIDRIVLHPVAGPVLLAILLFSVFQAVFVWAAAPMDWIKEATERIGEAAAWALPEGWLRSLVVDGIVAGAGAVVVFLPQIVILFFFILLLEESGYLPRAAFLLDRLMGGVGLSGRAFIPLLSSFACAIPGIMAARTVPGARDRLVTILIAPLMTCSARLPVYALLIAAFVPSRRLAGVVELQGVVLFLLYLAGIAGGLVVAWVLSRFGARGGRGALMMELPVYHWPTLRSLAIGLWQRATIFVRRVGGIILVLSVALWFLASFPAPPPGATGSAIEYSFAGVAGKALATAFAPIGFNWQISVALIPGLAAREVAVGALGTVYALSAGGADAAHALAPIIARSWSVATGLALLAWYVFAPQCLATLATVRRETGGWATPIGMAAYLFALAYLAAFATYHLALALGAG